MVPVETTERGDYMKRKFKTMDANEAVANVAYRVSEVIAIYPITPSSPMGEWADQWASESVPNAWGSVPHVVEMQSEGGAAGARAWRPADRIAGDDVYRFAGIAVDDPNMNKIAGELTPPRFTLRRAPSPLTRSRFSAITPT